MKKPKILCVDDEPRVLEGLQRVLFRNFDVVTSEGGAAALARLQAGETFEVVVSDMRMPSMNGATLLAEFRKRAPNTVRVLLTGQSELEAAIAAVNEGQIFRFLTKPCSPEVLVPTLESAVAQHRLVTAEKELLEKTLVGSVRALAEVLAMTHPEAFGRAPQRYERARGIAERLQVPDPWHVEVACILASVGYAVLPDDVVSKLNRGEHLDARESEMLAQVPAVAERVLGHIPRLDKVKEVLRHQKLWLSGADAGKTAETLPVGARILRVLHDLSVAEARDEPLARALSALAQQPQLYGADVLAALASVCEVKAAEVRALALVDVRPGMVFVADVKLVAGTLLVASGQRATEQLLMRLRNFGERRVKEPIICEIPPQL